MSKQNKFFGTCNGETVQLSHVGYVGQKEFKFVSRLVDVTIPDQVVKYAEAYGGGKPTVWAYAIGNCPTCDKVHFANRRIARPSNPSNHKCGGRCRSAQGHNCECSCGGKNHGAN